MTKSHQLYIYSLLFVTICAIIYYNIKSEEHKNEMNKIIMLEAKFAEQESELEKLRATTQTCNVGTFLTPRSCYENSNYECSWNEFTKRCETKSKKNHIVNL